MRASLKWNRSQKKGKKRHKFKSGLEKLFAVKTLELGLGAEYEPDRFQFVKKSHYTPDWKIAKDTYVETKGYFAPSDRSKLLTFLEQYPHIRVYLLFGNASNRLNRKSSTTYGQWATKHGIKWADISKGIPKEWWNANNESN